MYRVKQCSQMTGISVQTIHYYERIGLFSSAGRTANGYRSYGDKDIERLRFIRRARQLDFPLANIREILMFRDNNTPPCDYVAGLISQKITEIDSRIGDLEQLRDELSTLSQPELRKRDMTQIQGICPILETSLHDE